MAHEVYIVFDGPPSHESGRFVEVEDADGRGVRVGTWEKHSLPGFWRLGPFIPAGSFYGNALRASVELGERLRGELDQLHATRRHEANDDKLVTCVFCGLEYPPGTPTSNHEALTAHVRVCPRHPLGLENARLRAIVRTAGAMVRNVIFPDWCAAEARQLREEIAALGDLAP